MRYMIRVSSDESYAAVREYVLSHGQRIIEVPRRHAISADGLGPANLQRIEDLGGRVRPERIYSPGGRARVANGVG